MGTRTYQREFEDLTDRELEIKKHRTHGIYLDAQTLHDRDVMHTSKQQLHAITMIQMQRGKDRRKQDAHSGLRLDLGSLFVRKALARTNHQDDDDE